VGERSAVICTIHIRIHHFQLKDVTLVVTGVAVCHVLCVEFKVFEPVKYTLIV
jgi:hypothetical protein